MGRQITFNMLSDDCKLFLDFVQNRDPVVVVPYTSRSAEVHEVRSPCGKGNRMCLWNQSLLPSFEYRYIPESEEGPYYRTNESLPLLEFSRPDPKEWNDKQVLTQGRVWCSFEYQGDDLEKWFNAIIRWMKKNFVRHPSPAIGGYVGPAAFEWFKMGGILLANYLPVLSPGWISVLEAQERAREEILKLESAKPRSPRRRR